METLTTTKGHTVETNYSDNEVLDILKKMDGHGFAKSLANSYDKYNRWTEGQRPWAHKIAIEHENQPTEEDLTIQLDDTSTIITMFDKAADKLKWPKITFEIDGKQYRFYRYSSYTRFPREIGIRIDGRYVGRLTRENTIIKGNGFDPIILQIIADFADDPLGYASRYGHLSGRCCFCNKKLTDERSTTAGYGPVCAKNYGLEWGKKN